MSTYLSPFIYRFKPKGTPPWLFIFILLSFVAYALHLAAQSSRKKQQHDNIEAPVYDRRPK